MGDQIGVDWDRFDLEQFRAGMDVEFEHGTHDPQTDVTGDDPLTTGKIAFAHMKEFPTTTSASSAWRKRRSGTGRRAASAAPLGGVEQALEAALELVAQRVANRALVGALDQLGEEALDHQALGL